MGCEWSVQIQLNNKRNHHNRYHQYSEVDYMMIWYALLMEGLSFGSESKWTWIILSAHWMTVERMEDRVVNFGNVNVSNELFSQKITYSCVHFIFFLCLFLVSYFSYFVYFFNFKKKTIHSITQRKHFSEFFFGNKKR